MIKFNEIGFKLLPHRRYFSDLAHSDHFTFPYFKKCLGGRRKIASQTLGVLEDLGKYYYLQRVKKFGSISKVTIGQKSLTALYIL